MLKISRQNGNYLLSHTLTVFFVLCQIKQGLLDFSPFIIGLWRIAFFFVFFFLTKLWQIGGILSKMLYFCSIVHRFVFYNVSVSVFDDRYLKYERV